jgi:sugar O-acyltransferase (sialic acid O-acetyltransferase NeuD family)
MSLVVLCAGGHARVIIEALRSCGIDPFALTDRDPSRKGSIMCGIKIIGTDEQVTAMAAGEIELANGLGNRTARSDSGLGARRALFERFCALGYSFPVIAHAASTVASDAELKAGAQIMAGALVQSGARVGYNVIVNTGAIVEHDCRVGDHAHIAPGAVLCGGVAVAEEAHIGAGAVVLNGLSVGRGAVVAAGAVVTTDVGERGFAGVEGWQAHR